MYHFEKNAQVNAIATPNCRNSLRMGKVRELERRICKVPEKQELKKTGLLERLHGDNGWFEAKFV